MLKLSENLSIDPNPWLLAIVVGTFIGCWLIILSQKISKQRAEELVIHLEYLGTIIIGISIMTASSISVGNFHLLAQSFNPWLGVLFIGIAYQLKIAMHKNLIDSKMSFLRNAKVSINKLRNKIVTVLSEKKSHLKPKMPQYNQNKNHTEWVLKSIYGNEIRTLCSYALRAYEEAIRSYTGNSVQGDFWYHIRSFLNYTADVSKFFFPPWNKDPMKQQLASFRADSLKHFFQLIPNSQLGDRIIRNHLEHIDERFDVWATRSRSVIVIGCGGNVSPKNVIGRTDASGKTNPADPCMMFYYFNETSQTISFHDDSICLKPLILELERIKNTNTDTHV